ncbi:ribosomal protein S18 [Syncephalastrum racemosum]|uniref:Small ribosomal subunit protein bS18m n=1 Tax=Syncephalastrum racemosum TaxID=13706 RepID=A0A1X2H2M6_SYNRA|nr:ribosomal protein S18 [Syncephalastrum racemosum]
MLATRIVSRPLLGLSSTRLISTSRPSAQLQEQEAPQAQGEGEIYQRTLNLLEKYAGLQQSKRTASGPRFQKSHQIGDTYHPHDLNDKEYQQRLQASRRKPQTPAQDPFDVLDLDPLHEYKNTELLSYFVSDMGKILPRNVTGVTAKNQRKLAKAIKRARAMGLLSCTSKAHV